MGGRDSFLDVDEKETGWCWGWHGADGVLVRDSVVEDESKKVQRSEKVEITIEL